MATVHDTLADLLEPLGECMTPEVAEKVIQLLASAAANERIGLLAGKSAGRSSPRLREIMGLL
jgi:hypothetical protein